MRQDARHRCDFCGGNAVAFQRGASVCGRCGTDRTTGGSNSPVKSKRMALVGLFSSGLLIKMMLGSVAFAAVGSWAAAAVMAPAPTSTPPVVQTQTTVVDESPAVTGEPALQVEPAMTIAEIVSDANEQAAAAHEMAAKIQKWANCIANAAINHRGKAFDPKSACEYPDIQEPTFGFGNSHPPADAGNPDHPAKPEQANNGNKDEAPGAENRPSDKGGDKDLPQQRNG